MPLHKYDKCQQHHTSLDYASGSGFSVKNLGSPESVKNVFYPHVTLKQDIGPLIQTRVPGA